MKNRLETQKFLSEKREKRRLKNIAVERMRRKALAKHRDGLLLYLPQTLKILQRHIPKGVHPGKEKSETIKIPSTFSIVDNTENALRTIYQLVVFSSRRRPPREIYFDHSDLVNFDLAAEEILDIVALDFQRIRRWAKGGLQLSGKFPASILANRFIRAVGIIKNLELTPFYLRHEEEKSLKILRCLSYRALLRASEVSPIERAAQRLIDYFNECLETSGRQLTEYGRQKLGEYAGEVLDNAIEHSETQDWVLAGYLDLSTPERVCEISIFNFGKSYADTFSELPEDHFTRRVVDPFIEIHQKKGFFRQGWERDNLYTVAALQECISSKNENQSDNRGSGTVDLIQFFQEVYGEKRPQDGRRAKMVIISGKTYILFDGRYEMLPDSNDRQIIAFNSENTLELPPDQTYVKCLDGVEFPGTIVSIRFPLPRGATEGVGRRDER